MMNKIKIAIAMVLLLAMSSCYNTRNVGYLQDRKSLPQYGEGAFVEYRLQVNDEIMFRVITTDLETASIFQSPGTSSTQNVGYRIFEDGTVDLPFINKVPLLGKTLDEAQQIIQERMSSFVPNVQVKVALATGTFCVIGDAGRGYFPIYKERLTIFQALSLCGGISESANYHQVKIIRTTAEGTKVVSFDIRSESVIGSEFYYIYPNDVIYLDVSKKRFWAINSVAGFIGIISTSLTFLLTVFNTFKN